MSVKNSKQEGGCNKELEYGKGPFFDLTAGFLQTTEIYEKQGKWTTAYELQVEVFEK